MNNPEDLKTDIASEEVFMQLFLQSERRILGFILALVPHLADAEDLLQETCSIMWRKFDQFERNTDFTAWGISIARYRVLTYRRKAASSKVRFNDQLLEKIADAAIGVSMKSDERALALQTCLAALREKDRELIRLRYFAENSTKQTAEQLGRSVDSVYKALNRVHDSLLWCIRRSLLGEV
ncbi:sigma-70 family RNA polymerase sigma factor [Allorhodopirellula solitaria]|uniref:RNA polymerase sigma factor n=1 Tax=Allorhodopirellula solitaria TaxID=2527987 RepID=A0A5C5X2W2_9BACT|nr:sigma-70 family RNA polymerase sigma factor [Allorhodopirellula solitaria]TWT56601.1 RNA polymerase sigma factor [Allorhodopirellula solitaria]